VDRRNILPQTGCINQIKFLAMTLTLKLEVEIDQKFISEFEIKESIKKGIEETIFENSYHISSVEELGGPENEEDEDEDEWEPGDEGDIDDYEDSYSSSQRMWADRSDAANEAYEKGWIDDIQRQERRMGA
jgi:hypothetical protein